MSETDGGKEKKGDDGWLGSWSVYVVVCWVIVGGLLIVLVGFLLFHLVLVCKGKTTREFIKQNRSSKRSRLGENSRENK